MATQESNLDVSVESSAGGVPFYAEKEKLTKVRDLKDKINAAGTAFK